MNECPGCGATGWAPSAAYAGIRRCATDDCRVIKFGADGVPEIDGGGAGE